MITFLDWLIVHDTEALLRLLESAEYFDPQNYNPVFEGELEKLAQSHHDPEVQEQIAALRGFDFGSYVARSLVRAGFRNDDVETYFHDLIMKLLLSPGRVFKGWNPKTRAFGTSCPCFNLERHSQRRGENPKQAKTRNAR